MDRSCNEFYKLINSIIYNKRFVAIAQNFDDIKESNSILLKIGREFNFLSLDELSQKSKVSTQVLVSCIEEKFANENNNQILNRNVNGYYNSVGTIKVLFPMHIINGMNVGTTRNLREMQYREELDIFI